MLRNLRKKFAPLNFHKRNETDADFEAIEFGRCGHVIYRTETDVNNLKLKFIHPNLDAKMIQSS